MLCHRLGFVFLQCTWVRGVQLTGNLPLVNVLTHASIVSLVAYGGCPLTPSQERFKTDFVPTLNDHVGDLTILNGPTDGSLADTKEFGGF